MVTPETIQIYLIIAVAIVAMLLMAGAIVLFVVFYQKRMIKEQLHRQELEFEYQQKMLQAELESQESERKRVAADLHDSIGGMLSTIRVGITTIARMLPDQGPINPIKKMLDDTISSVRRISRDLMPSTLEKFGLLYALKELCERFQLTSQINIRYEQRGESIEMNRQRELMVYRIVQELLNNAIKHAQASLIQVSVIVHEQLLTITVEDDGIGFDPEALKADKNSSKGLGLFNIENRVRLLEGKLEWKQSGHSTGSKIVLTIPL